MQKQITIENRSYFKNETASGFTFFCNYLTRIGNKGGGLWIDAFHDI